MANGPAAGGGFTIRCRCGAAIHTDISHVGRTIRCRCGESVRIERPVDDARATAALQRAVHEARSSRRRRVRRPAEGGRAHAPTVGAGGVRALVARMGDAPMRFVLDCLDDLWDGRAGVRWTARLAWGYLALVVVTWILLLTTSERFLPLTLLAYGPRAVVLLPLALLVPAALFTTWRAVLPAALAALVGLGPIMGGRVSRATLGEPLAPAPPAGALRVVTFNAGTGMALAFRLPQLMEDLRPDLLLVQECRDELWDSLATLAGMATARHNGLCTLSRWPIVERDTMPYQTFEQVARLGAGGSGQAARYRLATPDGPLYVVNVHLETARKGLEQLLAYDPAASDEPRPVRARRDGRRSVPSAPMSALERLTLNAAVRNAESARAAKWAVLGDSAIPVVVAGDFNLPVESVIYRRHWSHCANAFDAIGTGFGWTKREGTLLRIRIDHVLLCRAAGLRPLQAVVGPDLGSDHRPMVVDLARGPRGGS